MFVTTDDGVQLYVERRGKGIPCLYLHGGPGYWSKSFSDLSGSLLESEFEMIYLDQRGCGRSSHQSKDYSLKRLTKDIEEVRVQLNIEKFYLLAHSFGGILAVNYANHFSDNVFGLLLTNVTLNMKESLNHQYRKGLAMLNDELLVSKNPRNLMEEFRSVQMQLLEKNMFFSLQFIDVTNKDSMDAIDKDFSSTPKFQEYVFSSDDYLQDFTLVTKEIKQPVLILAGTHDNAVGPKHHQDFKFPNSFVRIINSGHHPYVENPLDFQQAIKDFSKACNKDVEKSLRTRSSV
jgi:proline iminopeptidase